MYSLNVHDRLSHPIKVYRPCYIIIHPYLYVIIKGWDENNQA